MMYIFQSLVKPILVYGSEVWGVNMNAIKAIDKVFLWYARSVMRVKSNTSNLITLGECGIIPPSIICHKQVLCYFMRLRNMSSNTLVKWVFDELTKLDDIGFKTWISSVRELASRYNISLDNEQPIEIFKRECQEKLECHLNVITRRYKLFKTTYELELYLDLVKNPKYRTAISRLRTSLHMLAIERGRHTRPITPLHRRLCPSCNEIEDEKHFVLDCLLYRDERVKLYDYFCRNGAW